MEAAESATSGWKLLERRTIWRHRNLEVNNDRVIKPNGEPDDYPVVKITAGASALPLDDQGNVYLGEEFRYAVGRKTIEASSGAREANEPPLAAARRELREELGIEAAQWTELGQIDLIPSRLDSPATLFLAEQLRFVGKREDGVERIRVVKLSLAEAVQMALDGRITHAPSCVLILRAAHHRGQLK